MAVSSRLLRKQSHAGERIVQAMSKPQFHIAVVGAGLGGLAAAIGIARAGHKVTVLEQASALGEVR